MTYIYYNQITKLYMKIECLNNSFADWRSSGLIESMAFKND